MNFYIPLYLFSVNFWGCKWEPLPLRQTRFLSHTSDYSICTYLSCMSKFNIIRHTHRSLICAVFLKAVKKNVHFGYINPLYAFIIQQPGLLGPTFLRDVINLAIKINRNSNANCIKQAYITCNLWHGASFIKHL